VEEVSGTVELTSEEGKGTVARFRVPVRRESVAVELESDPKPTDSGLHGREVIVIDDDLWMGEDCRSVLRRAGAHATAFTDAVRAFEVLRERGTPPDCIVVDQVMPGMSGSELVEALRAVFPGLPAVMQSGYLYTTYSLDVSPRTSFLSKPFSDDDLIRAVRALL
jgi:FixJ family two-component response regulator